MKYFAKIISVQGIKILLKRLSINRSNILLEIINVYINNIFQYY